MRMIAQPKEIKTRVQKTSPQEKRSKTADAIARDKAVKRKTAKMSNKQAVLQSSESLACAIKEMASCRDEQRKSEIMLWLEHESKERAKDRELEKMKLEALRKEIKEGSLNLK